MEFPIVVIAVLGILSLILVPQFSLYGDKAMGTTALADVKSLQSMYVAQNMDSIDALTLPKLASLVGMTTVFKSGTDATGVYTDASKSKALTNFAPAAGTADYYYRRGDVVLKCTINFTTQAQLWSCTLTDGKRFNALANGLKVDGVADDSKAVTAGTPAAGKLVYVANTVFPK